MQYIDINNAFINGTIQEDIYMKQPPGFECQDSILVCRLHRALYGVKQALHAWYERLNQVLLSFGFTTSKCDPSLFIYSHSSTTLYALVIGTSSTLIHNLITKLNSTFALKELG